MTKNNNLKIKFKKVKNHKFQTIYNNNKPIKMSLIHQLKEWTKRALLQAVFLNLKILKILSNESVKFNCLILKKKIILFFVSLQCENNYSFI